MLNGLDLFSGYGGLSLALSEWVRPIAYCENERYAQGILLSRIEDSRLREAPIWDDVRTLDGTLFRESVDIIYGGFPCQDISVAGVGKGMAGERSGLFREIVRLAKEIEPTFLFLENVPAIRTRGLDAVIEQLTDAGYDLRWCSLSAAEVGANHKRERWFLLGQSTSKRVIRELSHLSQTNAGENRSQVGDENAAVQFIDAGSKPSILADADRLKLRNEQQRKSGRLSNRVSNEGNTEPRDDGEKKPMAHTDQVGLEITETKYGSLPDQVAEYLSRSWWAIEPDVGRVVDGHPSRVDRVKACGNGVVPLQAKTAFEILMGLRL